MGERNLAALARCNITHLALEISCAAWTFFGFVLWHSVTGLQWRQH
jgi:hypothetical protein